MTQSIPKRITDNQIQWAGAVLIIAGHSLNAVGPVAYPWNIVAFGLGTLLFLWWAWRTRNSAQITVNVISLAIAVFGLVRAL